MRPSAIVIVFFVALASDHIEARSEKLHPPIVINTWNFTDANALAWRELSNSHSAIDAIEVGCGQCEIERCDGTVGWGGSPSENGETTLDAMIMDGETYDVGAVGAIRRIKSAISVARMVLERTNHTLLVGEMATQFALSLGFKEESLTSDESRKLHAEWLQNSCQPNFWKNVVPNPRKYCGPYRVPGSGDKADHYNIPEGKTPSTIDQTNIDFDKIHDTIGMVAIDSNHKLAAGTSTNGLRNKILGRVGDSPIPGAGAYAAKEAGAAAATGDGDVMMRFLLSYQAVENLRRGMTAQQAADDVIKRQTNRTHRPYSHAAVVVLDKSGYYGAACCGFKQFPFIVSDSKKQNRVFVLKCLQ